MNNIIQKVIDWADERNLANPADLHAETLMLVTQFGQLASSINKLEESKDLIGRCIIEMIIICKMHNIAFVACLNLTKEIKDQEITEPKHVLNKILKTLGKLSENILAKKNFKDEIRYLLIYLSAISQI